MSTKPKFIMPQLIRLPNSITHYASLLSLLVLILYFPAISGAEPQKVESNVKKIVMMMNIVYKEYHEGIANGKIINAAEYEESQAFLEQALDRYRTLVESSATPKRQDELADRFSSLILKIKSKEDPTVIHSEVNAINSGILQKFNIQLSQTPSEPVSLENGRMLYMKNCKECHGIQGKGDGPIAPKLEPKPAVLADPQLTGDEFSKPYDNFQIINVGIANTAMVGWSDQFSEKELWDVTYFIRTFSNKNVKLPLLVSQASSTDKSQGNSTKKTFSEIFSLLNQSITAYREGRNREASESAFDAYLTYEKVESPLTTKRKELGLKLESSFGKLQAEIKRKAPINIVEEVGEEIADDLKIAQQVLTQEVGFTGLFIQSLSIIVREGFEAILIIAALITFLIKSRNQDKLRAIYMGVLTGIIGSIITAYILHEILDVSMSSQEMMEGVIMLVAVVVLFYVSYWLVSKIEAAKWQSYITDKMQKAVTTGSAFSLGAVAFLSVYREGFETVLFYKALYLYAGDTTAGIIPGFLAGCAILAVVYFLINKLGMRIPINWFFVVTSVFLYYMAFMFMGKGLHELQMGGVLSLNGADFLPEIPWLGMYPTWETFIGQMIMVLAYVGALIYTFGIKQEHTAQKLES